MFEEEGEEFDAAAVAGDAFVGDGGEGEFSLGVGEVGGDVGEGEEVFDKGDPADGGGHAEVGWEVVSDEGVL